LYSTQGLAGVLDNHESVAVRELADNIEPRRLAEGVHWEDGLRAEGGDGSLAEVCVDVPRIGLDVHGQLQPGGFNSWKSCPMLLIRRANADQDRPAAQC
jgi:hypothetical protein